MINTILLIGAVSPVMHKLKTWRLLQLFTYSTCFDLQDVKLHFLAYHKKQIPQLDLCALINTWYLMTLFACLLIISSTILKIIGDYRVSICCVAITYVCINVFALKIWVLSHCNINFYDSIIIACIVFIIFFFVLL